MGPTLEQLGFVSEIFYFLFAMGVGKKSSKNFDQK